MATNNRWENFKLSNPVIGDRYNRTQATGWQQGNLAQAQKNFETDPWFSLGHTIGSAWADNYNDRGISKGRAEMQDALNGYLGQFGTQQQDSVNYNPNMIKGEDTGMGSKYITQADGTQPNGVLGQTSMYFDANGNFNAQQPDLAGGKLMYRYNKYLNSDNPDSEARESKNDVKQINQMGDNIDFGKVDKEQAREYVRQQLEAKGRTPYQIEQVLAQFDGVYDSKYNKWNEAKGTDYLQKGIKALQGDNPDYDTAYMNLAAAAERGNKQATFMLQRLQYKQNLKDKLDAEARNRAWQMEMLNYKNNLRGGTRGAQGIKSSSGDSSGSSGGVLASVTGNTIPGYGYRPEMGDKKWDKKKYIASNPELFGEAASQAAAKEMLENVDGFAGYSLNPSSQLKMAHGVRNLLRTGEINDSQAITMLKKYGLFALSPEDRAEILGQTNLKYLFERPDEADNYAYAEEG